MWARNETSSRFILVQDVFTGQWKPQRQHSSSFKWTFFIRLSQLELLILDFTTSGERAGLFSLERNIFFLRAGCCVFFIADDPQRRNDPQNRMNYVFWDLFWCFFLYFFMSSTFFCVLLSKEILVFSMTIIHISSNQTWIWIKLSNISTT